MGQGSGVKGQGDPLRVGILFGGQSAEHEVSVVSAQGVLAAIDRQRFQPIPFGVTREGVWLRPRETQEALARIPANSYQPLPSLESGNLLNRPQLLAALSGLDVAFPLIHGTHGEDGTLQGLLELAGVPYVGAGVAASAIGLDKALMKALFRQAGLPVADYAVVLASQWKADPEGAIDAVEGQVPYPCFIKPANGGSSVGISKVRSREDIPSALEEAFRYDRKVLAEAAVGGREIECALLGNDDPQASPLGEIVPHREFYDYTAKYLDDSTELIAPVKLPEELEQRIQALAIAAFKAIDCAGMARVDFFLVGDRVYVNEINTIPGFTPISMYPKLWEVAGLRYADLITRLIELALERHQADARREKRSRV